jgi:hypothetical protein
LHVRLKVAFLSFTPMNDRRQDRMYHGMSLSNSNDSVTSDPEFAAAIR